MAKRGRPPKLTVAKQEEFCELIDAGVSRSEAARMLGCVPSTISKALGRDSGFRQRVESTEQAAERHRIKRLQLLAPLRKHEALRRLTRVRSGELDPGPEHRALEHSLQEVLCGLAAVELRTYIEEQ